MSSPAHVHQRVPHRRECAPRCGEARQPLRGDQLPRGALADLLFHQQEVPCAGLLLLAHQGVEEVHLRLVQCHGARGADLATTMQENCPELFDSFCCVHSVFEKPTDGVAAIWTARSITLASTSTRRAPNAFNHLHQMKKLERLGHRAGLDMDSWTSRKGVMKAFSIGDGEAKAAVNLANLPPSFVNRLQRMVMVHSFRACVTHAALAMDIIRLGCGPSMTNKKWQEDLKNGEYTIELLGKRIEADWQAGCLGGGPGVVASVV